jgi:hypothetical protein
MKYNKTKKAYQEILEVCNKYISEDCLKDDNFSDIRDTARMAENHLIVIDWYEKFGLELDQNIRIKNFGYYSFDSYRSFCYYGNAKLESERGYGRYISWEDNGKQPKNEWLFCIGFSTGAFIFGEDYPVNIFRKFWQELKSYKPDYIDSHNHCLYFSLKNAKKIFNEFRLILEKYNKENQEDRKKREIKKLEDQLNDLKSNI